MRRRRFDASGDVPHVPRRIDDPPDAIAPELIRRRDQNPRPGCHCPLDHGVRVVDINVDHHGRAAVRLGCTARKGWKLSVDHHHRLADRQCGMHHNSVWGRSARAFDGAERGLAEVDLRRSIEAH